MKDMIGVGILAGGKSERMGRDKALMRFRGEPMIARIARELAEGEVLVSAAEPGLYEFLGCRVVYDERQDMGPMEGLRRLLTETESEWLFLCAADMPLLRRGLVDYLAEFICSDYDCVVATSGGRVQPLCALYSKRVLPVVEEQLRARRLRMDEVLRRVRTKYVALEYARFDASIVANVNTPEELARLSAPRVLCVCGRKHSGKTTLVCRLIEALRRDGYAVAALKHDGHDCYADAPGSDTARFAAAGAASTAIFTDTRYSLHIGKAAGVEELIQTLCERGGTPDLLLIEGLKASAYPKIELASGGGGDQSICTGAPPVLLATEETPRDGLACRAFGRDDIAGICGWIEETILGDAP